MTLYWCVICGSEKSFAVVQNYQTVRGKKWLISVAPSNLGCVSFCCGPGRKRTFFFSEPVLAARLQWANNQTRYVHIPNTYRQQKSLDGRKGFRWLPSVWAKNQAHARTPSMIPFRTRHHMSKRAWEAGDLSCFFDIVATIFGLLLKNMGDHLREKTMVKLSPFENFTG